MNLGKLKLNKLPSVVFSSRNKRVIIALGLLLFLIFTIFFTVYLAKQRQIVQKEAVGGPAILSLSPNAGTYTKDQTFDVKIFLNTDDKPVVGVDVSLTFDSEKLQVQSVTPGTFFQEGQIVFKNEVKENKILLSLGSFAPVAGGGIYGTISFLATKVGDVQVEFDPTPHCKVVEQGGGDILGNTINGSYTITESATPTPTLTPIPTPTPTPTPTATPTATPIPPPDEPTPTPTPTATPQPLTGDLNEDGVVNSIDYSILVRYFNTQGLTGDLNRDGWVNTVDYSIMLSHWGERRSN